MHPFRTHTCGVLRKEHAGEQVRLSGWVHRKRDHGGVIFIDLRDHYGLTQVVVNPDSPGFADADKARNESVLTVTGEVILREPDLINPNMETGVIEVVCHVVRGGIRCAEIAAVHRCTPGARLTRKKRGSSTAFSICAASACTRTCCSVRQTCGARAPAPGGTRLHGIPDAHPDEFIARGRARLPGAQPPLPRPLLRAAAGAAAVQAAADGFAASTATSRSRRVSATKTPARTAAPASSTRSISRCPSSRRTISSANSKTCMVRLFKELSNKEINAETLPAHPLRRKPWRSTATTSRTSASASRWSTARTSSANCELKVFSEPGGDRRRGEGHQRQGRGRAAPQVLRRRGEVRQVARRQGPRLDRAARRRDEGAHRKIPERRRKGRISSRAHGCGGGRCTLLRRRQAWRDTDDPSRQSS